MEGITSAVAQVFSWGLLKDVFHCVTSGKLLNFSGPLFPHLQSGNSTHTYFRGWLCETVELFSCEGFKYCLTHSKCFFLALNVYGSFIEL